MQRNTSQPLHTTDVNLYEQKLFTVTVFSNARYEGLQFILVIPSKFPF